MADRARPDIDCPDARWSVVQHPCDEGWFTVLPHSISGPWDAAQQRLAADLARQLAARGVLFFRYRSKDAAWDAVRDYLRATEEEWRQHPSEAEPTPPAITFEELDKELLEAPVPARAPAPAFDFEQLDRELIADFDRRHLLDFVGDRVQRDAASPAGEFSDAPAVDIGTSFVGTPLAPASQLGAAT